MSTPTDPTHPQPKPADAAGLLICSECGEQDIAYDAPCPSCGSRSGEHCRPLPTPHAAEAKEYLADGTKPTGKRYVSVDELRAAEAGDGETLYREWCGGSYEWNALTDVERQRWHRQAARHRNAAETVGNCCEAAGKLREMTDPHAVLSPFVGHCVLCLQPENYTYHVPEALWRKVIPEKHWDDIVCMKCFHARCNSTPPATQPALDAIAQAAGFPNAAAVLEGLPALIRAIVSDKHEAETKLAATQSALEQAREALQRTWNDCDMGWILDGKTIECGCCGGKVEKPKTSDDVCHEEDCPQGPTYRALAALNAVLPPAKGGADQ